MYELAAENGIEISKRPDRSLFALLEASKTMVINSSTSLKFVTAYEYASIRAMYGDDSAVGSLVNVVTQGDYNDWKRSQALSSFNLQGRGLIPQINLLSDMPQDILGSLGQGLSGLGLSQAGVASVLPYAA